MIAPNHVPFERAHPQILQMIEEAKSDMRREKKMLGPISQPPSDADLICQSEKLCKTYFNVSYF